MKYYRINKYGRIELDKFTTYINNHDWCLPAFFFISIILVGLVEGM